MLLPWYVLRMAMNLIARKERVNLLGIPFDAKIGKLLDVYGSSMPNRSLKIIKFLR